MPELPANAWMTPPSSTLPVSNINRIQLTDHLAWIPLWEAYQTFCHVRLSTEVTDRTWTRLVSGRIQGFIARDADNFAVGFAHYFFHDDTWAERPICYMQDLFVSDQARGAGYGRALITNVVADARGRMAHAVYWLTHRRNKRARTLYNKLARDDGFIQYVIDCSADT
jgi:GNAT superfamily N-acetyltransferase